MFNSLAANRRSAFRMVAVQALVSMLVAIAFFLAKDADHAEAAAIGGGAVAVGSLVLAWRSLPATPKSAGWALSRMVSGLLLKWFVVLGAVFLALAKLHLPALPLIAGMIASMAASFLTLNSRQ